MDHDIAAGVPAMATGEGAIRGVGIRNVNRLVIGA
jgi:hypothetical protein